MLRAPLEQLCRRIDGARFATVFRADGAELEAVHAADHDASVAWDDYGRVLEQVQQSAQMLAAGALEELVLSTQSSLTVIRPVAPETFLAFVTDPEVVPGKARYVCRVTAPHLAEAL